MFKFSLLFFTVLAAMLACSDYAKQPLVENADVAKSSIDLSQVSSLDYILHNEVYNPEAVIPPQCYTKTNGVNNPCYVCHQTYKATENRSNLMADGNLQGQYEFSDLGMSNSWKNLFFDRSELIAQVSDDAIKAWINTDNYQPFVSQQTAKTEQQAWRGELTPIDNLAYPDIAFAENGLANDGSYWVAYNYKPFPSTFWPTNGSTGDAMIRLPKAFRQLNQNDVKDVYFANLALVEMAIKGLERISVASLSEKKIGSDLNHNQILEDDIRFIEKQPHYVGDASAVEISHMLYPQDTEFLHTVRYLGVNSAGEIFNAPRMKEVRYMKKHKFKSVASLKSAYYAEAKEKAFEQLPKTTHLADRGIGNGFGWTINAYIEDDQGHLRQQYDQELEFCNGCHKTVGSTIDQTFSFARKVEGKAGWGYINLKTITDVPNIGDEQGEFLTYLQRVGGGDEFRQNKEMLSRWFDDKGQVNAERVKQQDNIYQLIMPSAQRAMKLNKAYYTIVKEQSYLFGRDAVLGKADNVLQYVDESLAPLEAQHQYSWDMRLNWHAEQLAPMATTAQGAK